MDFSSFQFNQTISNNIRSCGYTTPTPIQAKGIPPVLEGHDLIGLAETGTGKTAAFMLPILERLMATRQEGGPRSKSAVRVLILAPTRELAEQINDVIHELGRGTKTRSTTVYGGVSFERQAQALRSGIDIVVGCPGRVLDHIQERTIDLRRVETLVLDEADHMFDMGFLPTVRRILEQLPRERQTLLFSATMPDEVRKLATAIVRNPVTVEIAKNRPVGTVTQAILPVPATRKTDLLVEILRTRATGSVVIFARTKHRAKRLGETLGKRGFKATSLQGNLSQNRRQAALDGFRVGKYEVLVATDIAARGIDVSLISHVINYDVPDTAEAYTHRIGRTGRHFREGHAITLVEPEDNGTMRSIERRLNSNIQRERLANFDYGPQEAARKEEPEFRESDDRRPQRHGRPGARGRRPQRGNGHGSRRQGSGFGDRASAGRQRY